MRVVVFGSSGYWGSKLTRIALSLRLEIVGEVNLPIDGAAAAPSFSGRADAAIVATPAETHFEIVRECLNSGLDVLVEKPMALSARDAAELHALAVDLGLVLSVDSTFLHTKAYDRLVAMDGRIVRFSSARLADGPERVRTPAAWDLIVHDVAILEGLGAIWPHGVSVGLQSPDGLTAHALIDLYEGNFASLAASRAWPAKVRSTEIAFATGERFAWREGVLADLDTGLPLSREDTEPLERVVLDFVERCRTRSLTGRTDSAHAAAVCKILDDLFGAAP